MGDLHPRKLTAGTLKITQFEKEKIIFHPPSCFWGFKKFNFRCCVFFIFWKRDHLQKKTPSIFFPNGFFGWWFQPIWKILVKMGSSSPNRDENKKYLKPPPCHALFVGGSNPLKKAFHFFPINFFGDPLQKRWSPRWSPAATNTAPLTLFMRQVTAQSARARPLEVPAPTIWRWLDEGMRGDGFWWRISWI